MVRAPPRIFSDFETALWYLRRPCVEKMCGDGRPSPHTEQATLLFGNIDVLNVVQVEEAGRIDLDA